MSVASGGYLVTIYYFEAVQRNVNFDYLDDVDTLEDVEKLKHKHRLLAVH